MESDRNSALGEAADEVLVIDQQFRVLSVEGSGPLDLRFCQPGNSLLETIPEPFRSRLSVALSTLLEAGKAQRFLTEGHDQTAGFVECSVFRVRDVIVITVRDVTAAHLATSLLEESEERFRSLFWNNGDAVFAIDLNGRFTDANPVAERLSGYSRDEIRGKLFQELCAPECLEKAMQHFAMAMARRPEVVELWMIRKDGRRIELSISGGPMVVRDRVVGIFGIAKDLTRNRQAEQDLRMAFEEAERANFTKDRFLAALSHELRTPLSPILLALNLWEKDESLPPQLLEDLRMIRRNVETEARLISDLLDVTSARHGRLDLSVAETDVHELLLCIHDVIRHEAAAKNVSISLELQARNSRLHSDRLRLQQIFWNLLKNAVKFTSEGGLVRVISSSTENEITIRVIDTGVGIAPEVIPRLFSAFEQGDPKITRTFGGLGLGLTLSRGLVDLLGGRVEISSEGAGTGSTFTVRLPLEHAHRSNEVRQTGVSQTTLRQVEIP